MFGPGFRATSGVNRSSMRHRTHKGSRSAYFPEKGGYVDTAVYDRYALQPGMTFAGPAIVEERESTLISGPSAQARVDERLNDVVELDHGK